MKVKQLIKSVSLSAMLVLVVALTISALSCANKVEESQRIGVAVTILPQAEFVESVGGERVNVTVMVPPGADPHAYEPKPSQIAALANAKMYAKVGAGLQFELAWMEKLEAANKKMLIVDCSKSIQLIASAEGEQEERHGLMDPHIWLSPPDAKIMVNNICDGLVQIDPNNKAYYEQNRDAYLQKLTQLDRDIKDGLSRVPNRTFMIYHPTLGYFAKEYNLTMISAEKEGREPTAAGIARLLDQARAHNIKVIIVSPQRNPESARVIAREIGGRVVFVDDLAKDYITNLYRILNELIQALE